jgi:fructokinase
MGGGIMKSPSALAAVREKLVDILNGYIDSPRITGDIENYVVPPGLGDSSGVLGAIALARMNT